MFADIMIDCYSRAFRISSYSSLLISPLASLTFNICKGSSRLAMLEFIPISFNLFFTSEFMQNILPVLRDCEYFMFIDFKRERIESHASKEEYRGSLFTNQELAIAIYLKKEIIAFQESGIPRDGMLNAIQGNAIPFEDTDKLVERVISEIKSRWRTGWRNEFLVSNKKNIRISCTRGL